MMDKDTIADLFSAFGPVSIRRMFSGYGLYSDGICFALHLRDDIFLKADAVTIPGFEAEGVRPFSYDARGKTVVVNSFWKLPERLYDDPDELALWARQALDVARRVHATRPNRKSAKKAAVKPAKTTPAKSSARKAKRKVEA